MVIKLETVRAISINAANHHKLLTAVEEQCEFSSCLTEWIWALSASATHCQKVQRLVFIGTINDSFSNTAALFILKFPVFHLAHESPEGIREFYHVCSLFLYYKIQFTQLFKNATQKIINLCPTCDYSAKSHLWNTLGCLDLEIPLQLGQH